MPAQYVVRLQEMRIPGAYPSPPRHTRDIVWHVQITIAWSVLSATFTLIMTKLHFQTQPTNYSTDIFVLLFFTFNLRNSLSVVLASIKHRGAWSCYFGCEPGLLTATLHTHIERWRCETQVPPPSCGCFEMIALHCLQSGRTVSFHFVLHGLVKVLRYLICN